MRWLLHNITYIPICTTLHTYQVRSKTELSIYLLSINAQKFSRRFLLQYIFSQSQELHNTLCTNHTEMCLCCSQVCRACTCTCIHLEKFHTSPRSPGGSVKIAQYSIVPIIAFSWKRWWTYILITQKMGSSFTSWTTSSVSRRVLLLERKYQKISRVKITGKKNSKYFCIKKVLDTLKKLE